MTFLNPMDKEANKQTNRMEEECWKLVICKETGVKVALDFFFNWDTVVALDFLPIILYPTNLSIKCERRTKIFSDFSDLKNTLLLKEFFFKR